MYVLWENLLLMCPLCLKISWALTGEL